MKFKVGDVVRVKEWNVLAREIPDDDDGNLETPSCFPISMRKYCGYAYCICRAFNENGNNIYELKTLGDNSHVLNRGDVEGRPWAFDECVLEWIDEKAHEEKTMCDRIKSMTQQELSQFLYWVYLAGNADGRRCFQEGPDGFFSKIPETNPDELLDMYYDKFND